MWFVSTHSRSKAAATARQVGQYGSKVSTHSRSKAAAITRLYKKSNVDGFNSQPLEGGCILSKESHLFSCKFQLTAARRRLPTSGTGYKRVPIVSTHSRSKAAAICINQRQAIRHVSTHSRSKAAAKTLQKQIVRQEFQLTAARRRLPPPSAG